MELGLRESTAIIFGGARGIGLAIGAAFARESSDVCLVDIDPAVTQSARGLAADAAADGRVWGVRCDATQEAAVNELKRDVDRRRKHPTLHLVYAAGKGSGKFGSPFLNLSPTDWKSVLDVNLMGAVNAVHAFASSMTDTRAGTILVVASVAGQIASPTDPPYSAAKAAVINFTQVVAQDLAPYGVRANVLCPGMVKTTLNHSVWQAWSERQPEASRLSYDDWASEKIARVAPLGRWQTVEEMADMAVFLASDRARNVTGQTVNVDGGQVIR